MEKREKNNGSVSWIAKNRTLIAAIGVLIALSVFSLLVCITDARAGEIPDMGAHVRWHMYPFYALIVFLAAGLIVYVVKAKKTVRFSVFIAILIILFGGAIALANPVFMGFDETPHFFKTAATLDGKFFRYDSYSYEISDSYILLRDNIRASWLSPVFRAPWSESRTFVEAMPNGYAQPTYPFYGYLFSALGLGIGELLHLDTGITFVLGRLTNVLGFACMVVLALELIPKSYRKVQTVFAYAALFPGVLFVAAHYTQDGVVYGIAFILIALFLRMKAEESSFVRDYVLFGVLLILLGPLKYPYILLGFLLLLIPKKNYPFKAPYLWIAVLAVLTLSLSAFWFLKINSQFTDPRVENVNGAEQIAYILHHPLTVLRDCVLTGITRFYTYYLVGFNMNGMYSYAVSQTVNLLFLIPAGYLFLYGSKPVVLSRGKKIAILILMAAVFLLTAVALYVSFNPVGHEGLIDGIQGRYFFGLIPMAAFLLPERLKAKFSFGNDALSLRFILVFLILQIAYFVAPFGIFL